MSLPVPTTAELNSDIVSQLEASLAQTIPILPKAFVRILAKILAGVFVLLFKYGGFIFLQLFVPYASDKETTVNGRKLRPLVEWGRLIGVGDPNPATRAELIVTVPVLTQVGVLKAGVQAVRTETGIIYLTTAEVTLNASTVQVRIRAASGPNNSDGSGTIGNLQPGDEVEFASPPPNVATKVSVASQAVTAEDAESIDRYRARIFDRAQRRAQGGAYADYQQWAEEVEGIVHAYPYAGAPGQVDVYIEASVASSGSPDGYPTPAQKAAVQANIDFDDDDGRPTHRPVNAAVNVFSITRAVLDIEIVGLVPDLPDTRTAIADGVTEFMLSREPYIEGLSTLPRTDRITQANVSGIVDQIASASGASITAVHLLLDSAPITAVSLDPGQKAKFGTASYV